MVRREVRRVWGLAACGGLAACRIRALMEKRGLRCRGWSPLVRAKIGSGVLGEALAGALCWLSPLDHGSPYPPLVLPARWTC